MGRATENSQKDSNFRLEEKLRDTNNWRCELQAELDAVLAETDQLSETRNQLVSSIDQTQRPLRVTTACLMAREERRAGDRVRDVVEVSLEKEVDTIRSQQGKMRDYLVQVRLCCPLVTRPHKYPLHPLLSPPGNYMDCYVGQQTTWTQSDLSGQVGAGSTEQGETRDS